MCNSGKPAIIVKLVIRNVYMIGVSESHRSRAARAARLELSEAERERRRSLRVEARFPAVVRGVDDRGRRFEYDAVIEQLSGCCIGLRMRHPLRPGTNLFVLIRLALTGLRSAASVAVRGQVVAAEARADGLYAVKAEFTHHRFIYAREARRSEQI